MKFLSVFCVVLYLHTGVTSNINNAQNVPASSNNLDFQKSGGSINNQYNSNESPVGLNPQNIKTDYSGGEIVQNGSNDQYLRSGDMTQLQGFTEIPTDKEKIEPQPTESILSHTLLQDLENEKKNLSKDDIEKLILPNTYWKPDYRDSDKVILEPSQPQPTLQRPIAPLKSKEQIRLELEAITLEKIKNLLKLSQGRLTDEQLASLTNSNLDKDSYNYLQYIINKAKKLLNIRSSAKELKRYMIVHPDGTVEHLDNLDDVLKKSPNYVAVKSADLGKYVLNLPKQSNIRIPQQASAEDSVPTTAKNINVDTIKPIKHTELPPSLPKENSVRDDVHIDKLSNSKTKVTDTVNVKNSDETLPNVSNVPHPTNQAEILPAQDSTKAIPSQSQQDRAEKPLIKTNVNISPYIKLLNTLPVYVKNNKPDNFDNKFSSPISQVSNLGNTEHSGLWFQDKDFWEKLKSDARNVFYFLFVPSTPQVKKETKTTIFANGTTVEEVTEIVDNEDGIPTATKTTKVTHSDAIM